MVANVARCTPGRACSLLQHLVVSLAQALSLEAGPVCVDRQREHAVGDEPKRLRLQIAEA